MGSAQTVLAKEKKQSPAIQCEQDGVLKPCADSTTVSGKTGKPVGFKAQTDETTDKPVKKKKNKKSASKKKTKRSKAAEE